MSLGRLSPTRKGGGEQFKAHLGPLEWNLLDFWRWSGSDLVSNATRGLLAEYLVGRALDCVLDVRDEWANFDLVTPSGVKVEVKSSAFVQTWHQEQLSKPVFTYGVKEGWDPTTAKADAARLRRAHVYVFALLKHEDKESIDPMDLTQWEFYAVATTWLNERRRSQSSITLTSLRRHFGPVSFPRLKEAVNEAAVVNERGGGGG